MKIRFVSRLLSLKLTLQFIIFGILVSYFSLLLSVYTAGKEIIQVFTNEFIDQAITSREDMGGERWLENIFLEHPEKAGILLSHIREMVPFQERAVASFGVYRDSGSGEAWEQIFGDGNLEDAGDEMAPEWISMLERTREKGTHHNKPIYLGQERSRIYMVDITPPSSEYHYIAAVEILNFNLFYMVRQEWDVLGPYTLSVIIFSLVFGQIFSGPLSRAIRRMTDKAQAVARGDENVSFRIRRLDDLGILSRSMDRMTHNLRHRARTLETMNRIDRAVLSSISRQELLSRVASLIAEQFQDSGVAVLEKEGNDFLVLALLSGDRQLEGGQLSYDRINNPPDIPGRASGIDLSSHSALRNLFGPEGMHRHTVAYPLVEEERQVGSIIITRDQLSSDDRKALSMLADQVGIALKSLKEQKAREKLYEGMLLSLMRTVDAKSRWTGGHSERVTELALKLAGKLNAESSFMEKIRIGGSLHDIGKLAIPEAILDKPGRLDEAEFALIRKHPAHGYDILEDIPAFDESRHAVKSHHERWDGKGYPEGLKGENIPFIARIITVCDVYDAITDNRPYRKGFSRDEAREFLVKERGGLFDPDLLDLFLEIFDAGGLS